MTNNFRPTVDLYDERNSRVRFNNVVFYPYNARYWQEQLVSFTGETCKENDHTIVISQGSEAKQEGKPKKKDGFYYYTDSIYDSVVKDIIDLETGLLPKTQDIYREFLRRWKLLSRFERDRWNTFAVKKNMLSNKSNAFVNYFSGSRTIGSWIHGSRISI